MHAFEGRDGIWLVALERGEVVHDSLLEFVAGAGIGNAWITGIGAVESVEMGSYNLAERRYSHLHFPEITELCSFVGDVAPSDGAPFLHAHVTIAGPDLSLHGGHLHRAVIAVTGEFMVRDLGTDAERRPVESIGLNLFCR